VERRTPKWNQITNRRTEETAPDIVNVIVGFGLALTPWVVSFTHETHAATNAVLVGGAIALIAIGALVSFKEWEEWLNLILGVWAIFAPWLLSFSTNRSATYAHVIAGIVVAVVAAAKLWLVRAHASTA
jgi:SPW repeat